MVLWLLFLSSAQAQVCACARSALLPTGAVTRPGEVTASLQYGLALSGDPELYRGLHVRDQHGDSMAGMFMPPDLAHTWTVGGTLGLPKDLSLAVELPWVYVDKLGVSEMPGDVDTGAFGDLAAWLRWGRVPVHGLFVGAGLAPTFPLGEPVKGSIVRTGRGTVGLAGQVQTAWLPDPRTAVALSVGGSAGLGSDEGYRLGANLQGSAGVRFTPRENGRLGTSAYTVLAWQGRDREDALVYENTGYLSQEIGLGASWRVWERGLRSATVGARGFLPLWQVVGDPMYARNFAASVSLDVVAR